MTTKAMVIVHHQVPPFQDRGLAFLLVIIPATSSLLPFRILQLLLGGRSFSCWCCRVALPDPDGELVYLQRDTGQQAEKRMSAFELLRSPSV
jgi:hypothetical protein